MDFAFTMEELVPVVARLTEQYTSFDSTSVSYEKAEQLMGAVLYCIQENAFAPQKASGQAGGTAEREDSKQAEDIAEHRLVSGREAVTAQQAYEMGLLLVKEKAERSLVMYNQMRSELVYYGNMYLHDIFEKELPEFFIRYDVRFEPQDTILTLDYPVLKDLSGYSGIDKIYEFMRCIQMEQAFLRKLPEDFCQAVFFQDNPIILGEGNNLCGSDNLCEAVLIAALGHILAEKPMREHVFDEADYMRIRKAILEEKGEKIKEAVEKALEGFIHGCCGEEKGLSEYLSKAIDTIALRVKISKGIY